jgi:cyanophycin synthetase
MEWQRVWVLRGPNQWARFPVLEVELQLGDLRGAISKELPGLIDRLSTWLPALPWRPAGDGLAGDFSAQLRRGTDLAHVLMHTTLELQSLAGSDVKFGLVRPTAGDGLVRVVVEYEEEELARACLAAARDVCLGAVHDRPLDMAARVGELRELAHDIRLGPSTGAIVRAARRRNIPFRRLNRDSLVQLGHGIHQRRILTAETDCTSAIAEAVAQDKQLTRFLLDAVGVPVPKGRPVVDAEDAWQAAQELGLPVVVKPQYGNHGRGVATDLTTREQVVRAYAAAREESSDIMVERFIPGVDHRLLVINGKLVAAALREPAQVSGDGRSTIRELVAEVNKDPRRSDGHATVLSWIKLDTVGLAVLAEQGFTPESVPPAGTKVLIRRNGNLSTGGTAADVTDLVHPEVAARVVEAAQVVGLDIAGVDVVATDISRPLEEQGAVVEVNAGPGLRMHLEPSSGKPRPVGEAVVASLYPEGQPGRIPIAAVSGVNGKTITTRLLSHLLRRAGQIVGMTCTDGTYIDGRRIETRNCNGSQSARAVLLNPQVETAVLETARSSILREGLGFDQCDVAVVTNIREANQVSLRGNETAENLARVDRVVVQAVAPTGSAVLNADDPLTVAMAGHCRGSVTYFARAADHPVVAAHRRTGGRAVFVRNGLIVLAEGAREEELTSLARVPVTHQGRVAFQVENVLAAVAAAWSLRLPLDTIRAGLATFMGDAVQVPGRFNVHHVGGATIIVDYAHNPSALAALVGALDQFPHRRRALVFSGSNCPDTEIVNTGEVLANAFDDVILYKAGNKNDRADGELNSVLRRGLAAGQRTANTMEVEGELLAIETAMDTLAAGSLLVIGIETLDEALETVQRFVEREERELEEAKTLAEPAGARQ